RARQAAARDRDRRCRARGLPRAAAGTAPTCTRGLERLAAARDAGRAGMAGVAAVVPLPRAADREAGTGGRRRRMNLLSPEDERELAELPEALRALLEAELAVGNAVVEVGHSFPAPPAGVYVKLARP